MTTHECAECEKNRAQKQAFAEALANLRRAAYAVADAWQNLEEAGEHELAEVGYPDVFDDYAAIVDHIDAWSRAVEKKLGDEDDLAIVQERRNEPSIAWDRAKLGETTK
jgi:hypothetical protein